MQDCRIAGLQDCRIAGLQDCRIAGLQDCSIAALQHCRIAELQNCRIAELQNCRIAELQNCRIAELQNCRIAELQNCRIAELQNCRIAELQNCRIAELQNCRIAELQNCRIAELQNCRIAELQNCRIAELQNCRIAELQNCRRCSALLQFYNPAISPQSCNLRDSRARAGLGHRLTPRAQRTRVGFVNRHVDVEKRLERDVRNLPAAPVDDGGSSDYQASGVPRHLNRLPGRAAGGEDVLDHEHAINVGQHEPAPQRRAPPLPFRKYGPDPERTPDFVTDDGVRERNKGCGSRRSDRPQRAAERFGLTWVLQHERALPGNRCCASQRRGGMFVSNAPQSGGRENQEARCESSPFRNFGSIPSRSSEAVEATYFYLSDAGVP